MEPASSRLVRLKGQILHDWEEAIRAIVPQAANQPHPILINTLPKFLDNMAEALAANNPRHLATEGSTIAQEHGAERARITNYTLENVFNEYRILSETVFKQLELTGTLTPDERSVIRASIDEAVKQSALTFTLMLEGIRQQFVATLSHDLRGPLTAARANVEMIIRYPEKREMHATFAVRAIDNLTRTDRMITDLLDATRVQAGETLSFEVSETDAVREVETAYHEQATIYGDRIRFQCGVPSIKVWWNSEAIRRVIENLVNNAVKYGSSHTPITIHLQADDARVILTVHNEGPPIPPEDQETLFKAFQRTAAAKQSKTRGWGLGLALVRGVAEGHGGSIIVDSTEGRGSTLGIDILQDPRKVVDKRIRNSG